MFVSCGTCGVIYFVNSAKRIYDQFQSCLFALCPVCKVERGGAEITLLSKNMDVRVNELANLPIITVGPNSSTANFPKASSPKETTETYISRLEEVLEDLQESPDTCRERSLGVTRLEESIQWLYAQLANEKYD